MISKPQKWILWLTFAFLLILSATGVIFGFAIRGIIPVALNDSDPNFAQIADDDRWQVYHAAQGLMAPVAFFMLVLAMLWAAFAGYLTWKLGQKPERESP
jgi:hypothetical protein